MDVDTPDSGTRDSKTPDSETLDSETLDSETLVSERPGSETPDQKTSASWLGPIHLTASTLYRDHVTAANRTNRFKQVSKALLPHVVLNCGLFIYLLIGAAMFQAIEKEPDDQMMTRKAERIIKEYKTVEQKLLSVKPDLDETNPTWRKEGNFQLYEKLYALSEAHEGRSFRTIKYDGVPTDPSKVYWQRWTFLESTLYALSILTTTGYTYVTPMTKLGQVLAVLYGLIGIPIMVLAAVDLGRFMSECLLLVYKITLSRYFQHRGWCQRHVKSREGSVRRVIQRLHQRSRSAAVRSRILKKPDITDSAVRQARLLREKEKQRRKLPLWVNASVLLMFCGLGALVYMMFETNITFMDAFFVAFNLLANLTMAEMKSSDMAAVIYIVCFVTFGLAVLTMCADLAAMELKWLFMKIHYFGRKIRRKRQKISDEDLATLMELIRRIREKYPEKRNSTITKEDIIQFILDEQRDREREREEAYRTSRHRRSTPFDPSKDFRFMDDVVVEVVDSAVDMLDSQDATQLTYL